MKFLAPIFLLGWVTLFSGDLLAEEAEEVKFRLVLYGFIDAAGSSLIADFDAGVLSVRRGLEEHEEVLFEKKLELADRQRLEAVLLGASPKLWSGYHFTMVFDGYQVGFAGKVGKKKLRFTGMNGGPSRLAGLMVVIDDIVEEKIFNGEAWAEMTAESEQFESEEAHMKWLLEAAEKRESVDDGCLKK